MEQSKSTTFSHETSHPSVIRATDLRPSIGFILLYWQIRRPYQYRTRTPEMVFHIFPSSRATDGSSHKRPTFHSNRRHRSAVQHQTLVLKDGSCEVHHCRVLLLELHDILFTPEHVPSVLNFAKEATSDAEEGPGVEAHSATSPGKREEGDATEEQTSSLTRKPRGARIRKL